MLSDGAFLPLLAAPDRSKHQRAWRRLIAELAGNAPQCQGEAERFHDHWHVCHHYVRELVDDPPAILRMLRVWLPPYAGPGLTLYRGENIDRMEARRVGIAWTPDLGTARTFASGLNATRKGGVLLRAAVPPQAIIAAPSAHARWLGENEFTVDASHIDEFVEIARFPPVY